MIGRSESKQIILIHSHCIQKYLVNYRYKFELYSVWCKWKNEQMSQEKMPPRNRNNQNDKCQKDDGSRVEKAKKCKWGKNLLGPHQVSQGGRGSRKGPLHPWDGPRDGPPCNPFLNHTDAGYCPRAQQAGPNTFIQSTEHTACPSWNHMSCF